jgi:phage tail-like protein
MPANPQPGPLRSANFLVEIDGITRTRYRSVEGLESDVDVVEVREGGGPTQKASGSVHSHNLILRWPTDQDRELNDWYQRIVDGQPDRRNGSIVLLDNAGNPVVRWNFINAFPAKWRGPSLNAEDDDVAIETIELAHEGISLA